jgi:hypothetical protein
MAETSLTWSIVDETAAELGAKQWARLKWRQRGVPADWKIKITQKLMSQGIAVALSDFDRIAA